MFERCDIYLKSERFRRSKFTLLKVKPKGRITFDNVSFDLQKH